MRIRKITGQDIETITAIYLEAFSPAYVSFSELGEGKAVSPREISPRAGGIFARELKDLVRHPKHHFVLAEIEGVPAGFALASLREPAPGIRECWLDDICVLKSHRDSGVASALWSEVHAWGVEQKVAHFFLESGIHNVSAHAFFEKRGFQPLATVFWMKG